MTSGDAPPIESGIAGFLRAEHPYSYCDGCLAFTLHLDIEAVRRAATSLARAGEPFERVERDCDDCERFGMVTGVREAFRR
jgi:hypothetical protein